jgi:lipopolysaccharide/colanic/teichoic acid biosynthesis glycosyltransferase
MVFARLTRRPLPFWKRCFDIVASLVFLVLLSPLLIAVALFIRLGSRGTVLFRQSRVGEMGNDFEILKFRTLTASETATKDHQKFIAQLSAENEVLRKPNLAGRFIPGGKFLRSWSIDELPQLINVLRGEMSLIGPRPDVLAWHDYDEWQLRRFETLPGLTGLWQVSGKNRLTFQQMIDLDIQYVDTRNIGLDFWILLKTVRVLFSRDNG